MNPEMTPASDWWRETRKSCLGSDAPKHAEKCSFLCFPLVFPASAPIGREEKMAALLIGGK